MKKPSLIEVKTMLALLFASLAGANLPAEQVVGDSMIIQGQVSIGSDSTTNTTFGNDTLVLRESNLRIYLDDTTPGGTSFPSNDWRIVANDTVASGSSYFAIEDTTAGKTPFKIGAGAANGALYVGSGGIGINTTSTDSKLRVWINSGDTPGMRLEQNNSGYTPQTWDVAGNEANFFVRDVTGGSRLPFRIRPGAPTSSIDISASGKVAIGTDSPKAKLHVEANAANGEGVIIGQQSVNSTNLATLHVDGTGYFASKLGIGSGSTGKTNALYVAGTAFISQTLEIGSSRATKENIREVTLEEAQATLKNLNPVQYNYIGDGEHQLGFIAEDVPDAVATRSRKSIVPMDFVAVLTKVVQEHERRETELQKTIQSQDALLKTLSERLSAMEQRANVTGASTQR